MKNTYFKELVNCTKSKFGGEIILGLVLKSLCMALFAVYVFTLLL